MKSKSSSKKTKNQASQSKENMLQIFAYILIAAILIVTIVGVHQTKMHAEKFETISNEVDSFTAYMEEKYPVLEDTRIAAQEKVDEIVAKQGA